MTQICFNDYNKHIYILYIYIYREREREREIKRPPLFWYKFVWMVIINIYVWTQREKKNRAKKKHKKIWREIHYCYDPPICFNDYNKYLSKSRYKGGGRIRIQSVQKGSGSSIYIWVRILGSTFFYMFQIMVLSSVQFIYF